MSPGQGPARGADKRENSGRAEACGWARPRPLFPLPRGPPGRERGPSQRPRSPQLLAPAAPGNGGRRRPTALRGGAQPCAPAAGPARPPRGALSAAAPLPGLLGARGLRTPRRRPGRVCVGRGREKPAARPLAGLGARCPRSSPASAPAPAGVSLTAPGAWAASEPHVLPSVGPLTVGLPCLHAQPG